MSTGKHTVLFTLVLLFLTFISASSADQKCDEGWYDVYHNGEKIGFEHYTLYRTTFRGRRCYRIEEASVGQVSINNRISKVNSLTTSYFFDDMTPLYEKTVIVEKNQETISEIEIGKKEIIFMKKLDSYKTIKKIPFNPDYTLGVCGPMLKYKGLRVGKKYSLKVISDEKCSIEEESVEIYGKEKLNIEEQNIDCYLIKVSTSSMPGIPINLWVDEKGRIMKTMILNMISIRVGKEKAEKFSKVITYSNRIFTDELIPDFDKISEMDIFLKIEKEKSKETIKNSAYQKIVHKNNKYQLQLQALKPYTCQSPITPITDSTLKRYLASSVLIQSNEIQISEKAREIIGGEKDSLKAVRLICQWIYENIRKQESNVSMQSAKETLNNRYGDCTEHAVLFCALARAIGIPARQVTGLVFTGDSFGFHAWTEAYCGNWIPVDATLSRVGTPACYISLGYDQEGKPTMDIMMKLMSMLKNTTMEIKAVTINGKKYDLKNSATFIQTMGNRCINSLWNIVIDKPEKWDFALLSSKKLILKDFLGSKVYIFPVFNVLYGNPNFVQDEISKILGKDKDTLSFYESDITRLKEYNLFNIAFTSKENPQSIKGKAILMERDRKMFLLILITTEEQYSSASVDLDKIIDGVNF